MKIHESTGTGATSAWARIGCAVWIVLVAVSALPAAGDAAGEALEAALDVERTLVSDDLGRHQALASRRASVDARLDNLYTTLDYVVTQGESMSTTELEALMQQIEDSERERQQIMIVQRVLVEQLKDRIRRVGLLRERLGYLKDRARDTAGPLNGTWSISLQPTGQSGTFRLVQTGTILSGTYTLDGGWDGSLQGTLVNRKVFLVRIDSKLGRSMEFEGVLSTDGQTIRGTWLNYDLAAEGGSEGQWVARLEE